MRTVWNRARSVCGRIAGESSEERGTQSFSQQCRGKDHTEQSDRNDRVAGRGDSRRYGVVHNDPFDDNCVRIGNGTGEWSCCRPDGSKGHCVRNSTSLPVQSVPGLKNCKKDIRIFLFHH